MPSPIGTIRARVISTARSTRADKDGRRSWATISAPLRGTGLVWNRIMSSPAVRAAQTIELASQGAGLPHGAAFAINWDRRLYLASSATLIDVLRELPEDLGSVLMVGHNPGLEDLIFDLVPDDGSSPLRDIVEVKFPTASFALLELDIDRWTDVDDGCARLVHLTRPRDLAPNGQLGA
jgi:phosphohistidine phosphatase